jgi:thymidylate kinase
MKYGPSSLFVAIEGIDACGKATQSKALFDYYNKRYIDRYIVGQGRSPLHANLMSFPNYDSVTGRAIQAHLKGQWTTVDGIQLLEDRGLILPEQPVMPPHERKILDALTFQCLQTANRFETVCHLGIDRLLPDTVWISDRYHASALAYGANDGLSDDLLNAINSGLPMPDIYILLDIPVELSIQRRPYRRDRYEKDTALLNRVRDQYLRIFSGRRSEGWCIIDGSGSAEDIRRSILELLEAVFPTIQG